VLLLYANEQRAHSVLKVGPLAWRDRGAKEQRVLKRLHQRGLGVALPRPLGEGVVDGVCWSRESAVIGTPMTAVSTSRPRGSSLLRVMEDVADWFALLAVRTLTTRDWRQPGGLPLRAEHAHLSHLRTQLVGVPAVLVHGDVGSGVNVLIDTQRKAFAVIDWETAREAELPLTDLLRCSVQLLPRFTCARPVPWLGRTTCCACVQDKRR
jgi:hypothetical protein